MKIKPTDYIKRFLKIYKIILMRNYQMPSTNAGITKEYPMRKGNDQMIDPDLVELSYIQNKDKVIPLINIISNNCGNVILINPLVIKCLE